jgi:hypothetical protein
MTAPDDSALTMTLIAFEPLTDHGLALPLFSSFPGANALHVAIPSSPGDPAAHIRTFELYSASEAKSLDASQHRSAVECGIWIDVFIWHDTVHVGTRAELWESLKSAHEEMERTSPLSLLALAEGVGRSEVARCAAVAYEWLTRDWGRPKADRWRVNSYLARLARRDLIRRFSFGPRHAKADELLQVMRLAQHDTVLELRSPRLLDLKTEDLPDLAFAADALGWRLEIVLEELGEHPAAGTAPPAARAMVMRLRHGRGRTQTQIPLRVVDSFFAGSRTLRDGRTGRARTMTLSKKADAGRNTMKLQLPEIAAMIDPVARFERRDDGVVFEVHDASSSEGRQIADLLDEGVRDGSTRKTQRGATWWRVLPRRH